MRLDRYCATVEFYGRDQGFSLIALNY